jgi:hypothetical protein
MRTFLYLLLWTVFLTGYLLAETVQFRVGDLPGSVGVDHYSYFVSGITLQANQELDLQFAPNLFGTLSNGIAGKGFELLLLQPNNPPGTFGDYGLLALANNTGYTGSFGVDFVFLGAGEPGPQPYSINQFDQKGNFISRIETGITEPAKQTGIPEPASLTIIGVGLLVMGRVFEIRRRGDLRFSNKFDGRKSTKRWLGRP